MLTKRDSLIALLTMCATLAVVAPGQSEKPVMGSSIFDWNAIEATPTKVGSRRQFFQAPTATIDEIECHVTTINPGEAPHPPHQHPDEELIIVKEGMLEAMVNGHTKRVGPGSVIFMASNHPHGVRNSGKTAAAYHVIRWKSPGMSGTLAVVAPGQSEKPVMGSSIFDWNSIEATPTKIGSVRKFFQAPTATLDELECHVTTLNPGETPHPPHQHPDEEVIIVKEGMVEALVNGQTKRVGPGSVIFQAANQPHSIRNVGQTTAVYHVFKWNSLGMLKNKTK